MLIGIITSSVYDKSEKITLPKDRVKNVLGYDIIYTGKKESPDGKDRVLLKVNDVSTHANFYWSAYNRAYMVAPSVNKDILRDLYISPIQLIPAGEAMNQSMDELVLKKGENINFEGMILHFSGYDMGGHQMSEGNVSMAAIVKVSDNYGKDLGEIRPMIRMVGQNRESLPAFLPNTDRKVLIKGINVEAGTIALQINKPATTSGEDEDLSREILAVEVSVKPLINVLWMGTILMIIGFLFSIVNYVKQKFA
jgi:cytochrome c-type biogenesis protein CcmF